MDRRTEKCMESEQENGETWMGGLINERLDWYNQQKIDQRGGRDERGGKRYKGRRTRF